MPSLVRLQYQVCSANMSLPSPIWGFYNASTSSLQPADIDYTALAFRIVDIAQTLRCFDERTKWTIIRNYLLAIVACAWITVHPNIGAPIASSWNSFKSRVLPMWYATRGQGDVAYEASRWSKEDYEF